MSSSYPPHYAFPSAPPLERALPKPPRLHWGWVLGLTILTVGLFASVWLLVQALWVKRMRGGKSVGFVMALANLLWIGVVFVGGFTLGMLGAIAPSATVATLTAGFEPFVRISSFVLFLTTVFTLRREMEAEPIDLPLSGGLTFLLAVVYFQYNLQTYGLAQSTPVTGLFPNAPGEAAAVSPTVAYPTAEQVGVVMPQTTAAHDRSSGEGSRVG